MDELLKTFISDAQDILIDLEENILKLESEITKDNIDTIFRQVHTIKGNSSLFDLSQMSNLTHKFETTFSKVRNETLDIDQGKIDVFLKIIDVLNQMVANIEEANQYKIDGLLQDLDNMQNQKSDSDEVKPKPKKKPKKAKPRKKKSSKKDVKDAALFLASLNEELDFLEDKIVSLENEPEPASISELKIKFESYVLSATEFDQDKLVQLFLNLFLFFDLIEKDKIKIDVDTIDLALLSLVYVRNATTAGENVSNLEYNEVINSFKSMELLSDALVEYNKSMPKSKKSSTKKSEDTRKSAGRGKKKTEEKKSDDVKKKNAIRILKSTVDEARKLNKFLFLFKYTNVTELNKIEEYYGKQLESTIIEIFDFSKRDDRKICYLLVTSSEDIREKAALFTILYDRVKIIHEPDVALKIEESVKSVEKPELPAPQTKPESKTTHLKVPIELIDQLINLAGESIVARNEIIQKINSIDSPTLVSSGNKISSLITRLQKNIMRTRMQPVSVLYQRIPRIVRDVSKVLNKKVNLIMDGTDVHLDSTLLDAISDPIMHIVRNAIDHGLESQDERRKLKKTETGMLKIIASLHGGNVILTIVDDGKGVDLKKVKEKIIEKGLASKDTVAGLQDDEILNFIFEPGFTTTTKVTTTSGRGVGMDVVRSSINKVGGTVDIKTVFNKGTTITITLPQTLSIITCQILKIGNRRFALPQQNLVSLVDLEETRVSYVEDHIMYKFHNELIPIFESDKILELNDDGSGKENETKEKFIAVVKTEQYQFGLIFDDILNSEEIVIKPLGKHFLGLNWFSGATILGDGEAILILDIPGMARELNVRHILTNKIMRETKEEPSTVNNSLSEGNYLVFRVFDQQFAISTREKPKIIKLAPDSLDHLLAFSVIEHRGTIVPLFELNKYYEINIIPEKKQRFAVMFHINDQDIGIVVTDIVNVIDNIPPFDQVNFSDETIDGASLIEEKPTMVLNSKNLLEKYLNEYEMQNTAVT
ncbi:MAG: chemotaxis protein CheW [Leptospirales bacterium]